MVISEPSRQGTEWGHAPGDCLIKWLPYLYLFYFGQTAVLAKRPWDTRMGVPSPLDICEKCLRVLLCLYHAFLVTALPPPPPSNVESACNDSGCEGPLKSTLHSGWRGNAQICCVFAKVSQDFWPGSWPKVFGTSGKKHEQNWKFVKNTLRNSVALIISHCFGHCPLPFSSKQC